MSEIQYMHMAYYISSASAMLFTVLALTPILKRFDKRDILVVVLSCSMAMCSILMWLGVQLRQLPVLYASRVFAGVAEVCGCAAIPLIAETMPPDERDVAIAIAAMSLRIWSVRPTPILYAIHIIRHTHEFRINNHILNKSASTIYHRRCLLPDRVARAFKRLTSFVLDFVGHTVCTLYDVNSTITLTS